MVHAALVCPLLWSPAVAAQQIVDKDRELNAGHPLDSYRVIGPATLTANNADILYIDVTAGGNVVLNDSRIVPGSSSSNGLLLDAGTALLQRTLIEARSTGLGGSKGSHATAVDSVIRAGSTGALL
ncbi:MAG TPA: autotransporter outer membrane beta-barrel domain-containing protein, partial [Pseudomonas sp.]|nr:autotransporter outer membrane beta-barrel domain-containing protein [Pseudomonas sp.]